jgi:chromosome segregation ATPase
MSHDNNDLQVPNLGPADRSPAHLNVDQSDKKTHSELSATTTNNNGGWTTTLILILLTAACSGLGYVGFGMQQTIIQQQQSLNSASDRINELEKLLNVANDSAVQTGETLEQRLVAVNQDAIAKYTHYDAEIAKLWDVANKRNKASLDTLTADFKKLSTRVDKSEQSDNELAKSQTEQAKKVTDLAKEIAQVGLLTTQVATVDKQLNELVKANGQRSKDQETVAKEQTKLKASTAQTLAASKKNLVSLKQSLATLQTHIAIVEETLGDEQSRQLSSLKKLTSRLSALEKRPRSSAGNIAARVRVNEQAISAIDGTRRQMNRDMMSLQRKVNALSVRINKL